MLCAYSGLLKWAALDHLHPPHQSCMLYTPQADINSSPPWLLFMCYRSGNGESGNSNPLALMGHLVVPKQQQLGLLSAQCSLCTVLSLQHCSDSCVSKCTAEMCCLQCLCEIQLLKTVLEVNTFERQNYLCIFHILHLWKLFPVNFKVS